MKDLSFNEVLRYFVIGIFFLISNAICLQKAYLCEVIEYSFDDKSFGVITGICLLIGTIIYTLYRAFFYQFLINPFMAFLLKKRFDIQGSSISDFIIQVDKERLFVDKDTVRKYLSEWAAQVHLLFNISICLFYNYIIVVFFPQYYSNHFYYFWIGIVTLILSFANIYKYKVFERKVIFENIQNQEDKKPEQITQEEPILNIKKTKKTEGKSSNKNSLTS